ncbi:MAG: thioredoxin domain-containing protein [Gemmatimonadota bacterium]
MRNREPGRPIARGGAAGHSRRILAILGIALAPTTVSAQVSPEEVRGLGYSIGDPSAPVHVVEFADFGCSACATFATDVMPKVMTAYVEKGRVHWQSVPFLLGGFRHASAAARAGECAGRQGKFHTMYERLFSEQRNWQRSRRPTDLFHEYARAIGLERVSWDECYRENRQRARTRDNTRSARRLRVRGTPTFFINGTRIEGALPAEQFEALLIRAEEAASR